MPMKLLKIRNFAAVVIVGCVGQMVFYALNTLWPPAISVFFTTDNIKIGLMSVRVLRPHYALFRNRHVANYVVIEHHWYQPSIGRSYCFAILQACGSTKLATYNCKCYTGAICRPHVAR